MLNLNLNLGFHWSENVKNQDERPYDLCVEHLINEEKCDIARPLRGTYD